jgi:hypothetical protein
MVNGLGIPYKFMWYEHWGVSSALLMKTEMDTLSCEWYGTQC